MIISHDQLQTSWTAIARLIISYIGVYNYGVSKCHFYKTIFADCSIRVYLSLI